MMTPDGFRELILYFADARDGFTRDGKLAEAQNCEDAIALAHRIETARRLPRGVKTLGEVESDPDDWHSDYFTRRWHSVLEEATARPSVSQIPAAFGVNCPGCGLALHVTVASVSPQPV